MKNIFLLLLVVTCTFTLRAQNVYTLKSSKEIKSTIGEFVTESNDQLPQRNHTIKVFKTTDGGTATLLKYEEPAVADNNKPIPKPEISFFPNPANNTIKVSFKNTKAAIIKIDFINLLGTKVKSEEVVNASQINLSALVPGVYFAKCFVGEQILTYRIIKQ